MLTTARGAGNEKKKRERVCVCERERERESALWNTCCKDASHHTSFPAHSLIPAKTPFDPLYHPLPPPLPPFNPLVHPLSMLLRLPFNPPEHP